MLVICMLLAAILEFVRGFNTQKVFTGLEVAFRGMADAFAGVVMLLVAAGVFAQGLSTIGFIQSLISIATSFGSASIILISHRITTLAKAGQILVLDKGRIAERGTHDELVAANGIYRKIYDIQTAGAEEAAK